MRTGEDSDGVKGDYRVLLGADIARHPFRKGERKPKQRTQRAPPKSPHCNRFVVTDIVAPSELRPTSVENCEPHFRAITERGELSVFSYMSEMLLLHSKGKRKRIEKEKKEF